MRVIKLIFWVLLSLLVIAFALAFMTNNATPITLDFYVFKLGELSVGIWLALAFVAGGFTGMAASSGVIFRERAARVQVEKRLRTTSKLITG